MTLILKALFCLALALSFIPSASLAQTTCSTLYGTTTCRDSSGNVTHGNTDQYGNTTLRDSSGNVTRGNTDQYGNSTWRDSNGKTTRCSADSFGNTTCR